MAFKIAYCAGHCLKTPGKRVPAELDETQTREWVLNDRVADFFAQAATQYQDLKLLRTDDPLGLNEVTIANRVKKANNYDADLYIDMHHNAGVKLGKGGGVVVYCYPGSQKGRAYQAAIYDAVIKAGGLKGNRSNPKPEKAYASLRLSKMPAVLIEYGFMDSRTDYPVISTEEYAKKVAYATMEAVAAVADLQKRQVKEDSYSRQQFVADVQKALGLNDVSIAETLKKTVTVSKVKNDTHPVVKPIQKRLMALGYTVVGAADGIAGSKFHKALMAFQKDNGCWADGEATARNKTWQKLLQG